MQFPILVEAMRCLGLAAARSPQAVRAELDLAIRRIAPAIDSVLIFEETDGQLACVGASGARVAYFAGSRIASDDLRALPALALARGHRATLGECGARGFHPADAFAVAAPLTGTGGSPAVVHAAAARPVDDAAVETIVALADHAGYAYALAREREAYLQRAEYDALTGLLAPRALRERLGLLIERARFAPLARIALLFVDTDRFKHWNDAYGHAGGDALLRTLAGTLRACADGCGDLAARNGGDEFCVAFVDTEKSRAVGRAGALRHTIEQLDLAHLRPPAGERVAITASIGVAAYPADAASPSELLERADAAMYHSKRNGRNAVSYYGIDGTLVML